MDKIASSPFWENIFKKLTMTSEVSDESVHRRIKAANHIREMLTEEGAVDEEIDVRRVGNKSVVDTSARRPVRGMAPLARLESDFDLMTSPKRKAKCKTRLRDEMTKSDPINDRVVMKIDAKIDGVDTTIDNDRGVKFDDEVNNLIDRLAANHLNDTQRKVNDRSLRCDNKIDGIVDKMENRLKIDNDRVVRTNDNPQKSNDGVAACNDNPQKLIDGVVTFIDNPQKLIDGVVTFIDNPQKSIDGVVTFNDNPKKSIDRAVTCNDNPQKSIDGVTFKDNPQKSIDDVTFKDNPKKSIDDVTFNDNPQKSIDGAVTFNDNPQKSIDGVTFNDNPQKSIDGAITCNDNPQKSIEGAVTFNDNPQKSIDDVTFNDNPQKSIDGAVTCNDNPQKSIDGAVTCNDNAQKSIDGVTFNDNPHKSIDGVVRCNDNPQKINLSQNIIDNAEKSRDERLNDKIATYSDKMRDRLRLKLEFLGASEDIFSNSKSSISNSDKKPSCSVTSWNYRGSSVAKVQPTNGNNSRLRPQVRKTSFWPTLTVIEAPGASRRVIIGKRVLCDANQCSDQSYSHHSFKKSVGTITDTDGQFDEDTNLKSSVSDIFVQDVATLTEWFLSELYIPFDAVRSVLVKQARDILLCHFAGNYVRFRTRFLEPAALFLRQFRVQREEYHACAHLDLQRNLPTDFASVSIRGDYEASCASRFSRVITSSGQRAERKCRFCQNSLGRESEVLKRGWPLCYDGRLVVHLGELDSGLVVPKSGDFYFYLGATELDAEERRPNLDTPTSEIPVYHQASAVLGLSENIVRLRLRCRLDSGATQDKLINDYRQFMNIMDWSTDDKEETNWASDLEDNLPSSEPFGEVGDQRVSSILRHLLVAVERGIDRLEWDKMKITNGPPIRPQSLGQTLVTSRDRVDTRDCSVQTSPAEELPETDQRQYNYDDAVGDNERETITSNLNVTNVTSVTETCEDQTSEGSTVVVPSMTSQSNQVETGNKEDEQRDDGYHDIGVSSQPSTISQVDQDLLHAEIAILPGCRSKCGRSVVFMFPEKIKSATDCYINPELPLKLAELLIYFGMIPKTEISKKGLVFLVDLSRSSLESCAILDEVFSVFQANGGVSVHSVLLWMGPRDPVIQEFPTTPFPKSAVRWELMKNEEDLCRLIPLDQLLAYFGGIYLYDHQEWIAFRKFLEPFVNGCRLSGRHLVSVMRELTRGVGNLSTTNAASTRQLIDRQKRHIHSTYQDEQLRHLEEEGETILRELRHYCAGAPNNQDYKDALEAGGALYGELRRAMNKLRKLAERRLKKLEECLHIKTLTEESSQVLSWLCRRGEESLAKHQMVAESLPAIKEQEEQFEKFYFLAMRQIEKGNDLLEEAALVSPVTTPTKKTHSKKSTKDGASKNGTRDSENDVEDLTSSLKERLNSFSERLEVTRERLEDTAKCYHLLDEIYEWALNTMNFVSEMKQDRVTSSGAEYDDVVGWTRALDSYLDEHPPIADEVFREMILLAKASSTTNSPKLLQQCQTAQARCVETVELVRARRTSLLEAARVLSSSESVRLRRDSSSSEGHHPKDWDPTPNPNKTTRSRSHPQNFWPRGSSTPSTSNCSSTSGTRHSACSDDAFDSPSNFYRQQNYTRFKYRDRGSCNDASLISEGCSSSRRRSMSVISGPPTGFSSPFASYTSFPSNPYPASGPLSTPRDCALQMDQYLRDKEEQLQSRGLITEDLTTRGPVASIEKDDSRWSHNNNSQTNMPEDAVNASITSCIPMVSRSSTGSRLATKGSPPTSTSTSSLHPVTQKPVKKHMRICPTWQLREEALHKAAQQVRKQNERLGTQHKLEDEAEAEDEEPRNQDSENPACVIPESAPTPEVISRSSSISSTSDSPIPVNSHLLRTESISETASSGDQDTPDAKIVKNKSTLMLIMGELIQTERDYVKSLEYIIENYCPELHREDIPQALRGQRNVIFGNIEKIYEFHSQYFLRELELCEKSPFRVGQYFLQYERQFYLYALYNKNKPKSDNLMSEYGTAFFREKQLQLMDKMDLASYLLKPVQRMGKYALLLKQLLKECPEDEKEAEYQDLKAAEEMVRFQLRHGNDLLAMDALRECDVNVKEQGRLLRQDEFLVWQGRYRKSLRRVFLFEDLILFSKARRDPDQRGLQEIYQYKQSIKTTDIGMTEQIGDSPTKFEIWFRKRKLHDTYMLQAASTEVKQAWAHEISRLLWKQALKNREIRLAEMSSMGIGNKPCLDIKPSEDQISDRSIRMESVPKATRFRNSVSGSSTFDQLRTNKRPHSIISVSSSSSSGSSCGNTAHPGGVTPFAFYGAALNLGFEPGDAPRSHHRSETQQSQCSTESGFCTDSSLMGDQILSESESNLRFGLNVRCRRKAERSDSVLSNDSITTQPSTTFEEFENNRPEPECHGVSLSDSTPTTTPEVCNALPVVGLLRIG